MSFSTEIKEEISILKFSYLEDLTFLSAFTRNNGTKTDKEIILTNENLKVIRKIFSLFKELFDISPTITQIGKTKFGSKAIYQLHINSKIKEILTKLMIYDEENNYLDQPKPYFVDQEDLKRAYLRGIFIATGSVNDPKTSSYHLEFFIDNIIEANFVSKLLKYFIIPSKIIKKDKGYMLYIKESEKISDFLRVISASRAVMYFEDIRIYRDHKNMTNRLNNCEQANIDKTLQTAQNQINDIDYLIENTDIDSLPQKLKEIIIYRKKYPESSYQELSEIISYETGTKLTKSGLNHRLKKIKELVNNLKNNS